MVVVASFRHPESAIKLQQRNVLVVLDKKPLGTGTLFVSERTLGWQPNGEGGFSMDYYNITLHAVSKDPNVYDKECIYILTDPHILLPGGAPQPIRQEGADDDSDAESEPDLSELVLVPEDPAHIQLIYDSIKLCQELNPDPADVDDEDDDNLYADAEDEMYIEAESDNQAGDAVIEDLADRLQNNSVDIHYNCSNGNDDEEFEDAD